MKKLCIIKKPKYSAKFLVLWMIGNLILLLFIYLEHEFLQRVNSPWIYIKDFFTLNIALFAISRDKIIPYWIYACLINQDGRSQEGFDGICKYTVFLNSVGEQPYFVEISNVNVMIDGVPPAKYLWDAKYSPEMDDNGIIRSLPLYLRFEIGQHNLDSSKNHCGKIMCNCFLQYRLTTESLRIEFPITCKLGQEGEIFDDQI